MHKQKKMRFRKRSDGASWLIYADEASVRRKLAVVRIAPSEEDWATDVERLEATSDEMPEVERIAEIIVRRHIESQLPLCVVCMHPRAATYVKTLVKVLGVQDRVVVRKCANESLEEVFESLAQEMYWQDIIGKRTYKDAWVIGDKESGPLCAVEPNIQAKFPTIHMALTRPAFEYWLLLHDSNFDGQLPLDQETPISTVVSEKPLDDGRVEKTITTRVIVSTSASACRGFFTKKLPTLARADADLEWLLSGVGRALTRLKETESKSGGISQMPLFFERLCRLAKRESDEVIEKLGMFAESEPQAPCVEKISHDDVISQLIEIAVAAKKKASFPPDDQSAQEAGRLLEVFCDWLSEDFCHRFGVVPEVPDGMLGVLQTVKSTEIDRANLVAAEHFWKLRCGLGEVVKGTFDFSKKKFLRLLATAQVCQAWCVRFSAQSAATQTESDESPATQTSCVLSTTPEPRSEKE